MGNLPTLYIGSLYTVDCKKYTLRKISNFLEPENRENENSPHLKSFKMLLGVWKVHFI